MNEPPKYVAYLVLRSAFNRASQPFRVPSNRCCKVPAVIGKSADCVAPATRYPPWPSLAIELAMSSAEPPRNFPAISDDPSAATCATKASPSPALVAPSPVKSLDDDLPT